MNFFNFYFYFILLYNTVLVLPYIDMNQPWVYIGKTLSDINHSRILYDPSPKILEIKSKINKWELIKIKSFCTTKENIRKVKRQPSEWEKIIANEATDKQLPGASVRNSTHGKGHKGGGLAYAKA